MAIKEVRKVKSKEKSAYIRILLSRGKINSYVSEKGFVAYDPEEVKAYKKVAHRGRPIKQK